MAFLKELDLPNGAVGNYHRILQISTNKLMDKLQVQVGSWPSYEAYLEEKPAIWNEYLEIDPGIVVERSQGLVLLNPRFSGASVVTDGNTDLEKAKAKQWSIIKITRDRREFGGFNWNNLNFDSDSQSQSRIQGGVQLAVLAQQASQVFSIVWTLQDNSVVSLNAQEMVAVGQALAVHVQTIHETARTLREQINSASTVEEVESVQWPA